MAKQEKATKAKKKQIATYLFLDIQTSGLTNKKHGIARITELGMLAIKRKDLLKMGPDEEPEVQNKFLMCFNPDKKLDPKAAQMTGFSCELLKQEVKFNVDAYHAINFFINCLEKPVCLISHNAFRFQFETLISDLEDIAATLPADLMCTDSLYAFYDILDAESSNSDPVPAKKRKVFVKTKSFPELYREKFYRYAFEPRGSYKLPDIYNRIGEGPYLQANRASNQCVMMMKCAIARAEEFVAWVNRNHCLFSEVF